MKFFEDRARRYSFGVLSFFFIFLIIFLLVPFKNWQGIPLCTLKAITGWPCPGCGLTRGMWHWLHGHWVEAIRLNALTPLISLIFTLYLVQHGRILLGKERLSFGTSSGQRLIGILFLLLFLGQWAINLYHHYQSL